MSNKNDMPARTHKDFLPAIINLIFSITYLGLIIRFLFRLFGANPASPFANFIYTSTAPLMYPFRGIFEPYILEQNYVFEFSTLIAIVIYALVARLMLVLVDAVSGAAN